ncbi:MAG: hypothetical protein ABGX53_03050 [Candidatus Thioglobus sp.]|jgi:hypothetical protein
MKQKIIKLILVASVSVFLSACWHEVEVVKAEAIVLPSTPVAATSDLVETDIMPSYSK